MKGGKVANAASTWGGAFWQGHRRTTARQQIQARRALCAAPVLPYSGCRGEGKGRLKSPCCCTRRYSVVCLGIGGARSGPGHHRNAPSRSGGRWFARAGHGESGVVQLLRARGPTHPPLGGSATPDATATGRLPGVGPGRRRVPTTHAAERTDQLSRRGKGGARRAGDTSGGNWSVVSARQPRPER